MTWQNPEQLFVAQELIKIVNYFAADLRNRSRTRMKLLHWERGGYVIFYKRMEQGRISHTVFGKSDQVHFRRVRWDELMLLVEGISCSAKRRKRFNFSEKS